MASAANAPICAYHGNFVRLRFMCYLLPAVSDRRASSFSLAAGFTGGRRALFDWRGRRRLLKLCADAELHQLAGGQRFGLAADDFDRSLEIAGLLQVADEVGESGQARAPAVDQHLVEIGA